MDAHADSTVGAAAPTGEIFSSNAWTLTWFCVAMFAGAFGSGYIPLACSMSPARMKSISTLGAGLLIGTALVIIIPEGIHMWYDAVMTAASESPASSVGKRMLLAAGDSLSEGHDGHDGHHDHGHDGGHDHSAHSHEEHWQIGAALAFGFALMLVIDRLSGGYGHSHSGSLPESTPVAHNHDQGRSSKSAMFGLVVHAAVDGVALGATSYSGAGQTSMLVFFAIMLHKAPASFGLTTFLLQNGDNQREIKSRLLIFALAAPVGAFLTYYGMGLGLVAYEMQTLALIMLFSGGTFLFVATAHILPEIMASSSEGLTWGEVWMIVAGILSPLLINLGGHGH